MKKLFLFFVLLCIFPVVSLASITEIKVGSCLVTFFDDWGFTEYHGEFDKVSPRDRMFFNSRGDVAILSVLSDAHTIHQETKSELFDAANSIIKNFQSDGESIVTLGGVDNCPRITIVDETDSFSKTQWFIFTGNEVVYIGFQSEDKYRVREYNSSLHLTNINR